MPRSGTLAVVLALVVAGTILPAASATAAGPTLSLSIDSTQIENGDEYGTATDPKLAIEAALEGDARELSEVVVRVNGDLYRNFSTGGDSFSKTVLLELDNGDNSVRVIVTDDEGRASSVSFTAFKDSRQPSVYLTAPYETIPYNPVGNGHTNGSWTTFRGTVLDASNVTTGTLTYWWNDTNDAHRASVPLENIGNNVTERVFLGHGDNRIRLAVNDEYGNTRIDTFHVQVSDGEPPDISLDPYPTQLREREFTLSGNVTDDVWLDKALVIVTQVDGNERVKKHIRRAQDYHIDPDRTSASFSKSMHLFEAGTYRVNVTARDETGKRTVETFRVERLPEKERPVVPEIRVDRDRTAVLDSGTLFIDGRVVEGQVQRVVVETRDVASGRTIGYYPIFSGTNKPRVTFARNVTIQPNRTQVIVRVVDAEGGEHTEQFLVDGATGGAFLEEASRESDETDAAVAMTAHGAGTGSATAAVRVVGARAGTRVTVPPSGGPETAVETEHVTVERVDVGVAEDSTFTLNLTLRDRTTGSFPAPANEAPVATAGVTSSLAAEHVSNVSVVFRVRAGYLDDHTDDPSSLTVYRRAEGEWIELDTARVSSNATSVRYRTSSPALTALTLAVPATGDTGRTTAAADDTGTADDAGDGASTGTAETATSRPTTAPRGSTATGAGGAGFGLTAGLGALVVAALWARCRP